MMLREVSQWWLWCYQWSAQHRRPVIAFNSHSLFNSYVCAQGLWPTGYRSFHRLSWHSSRCSFLLVDATLRALSEIYCPYILTNTVNSLWQQSLAAYNGLYSLGRSLELPRLRFKRLSDSGSSREICSEEHSIRRNSTTMNEAKCDNSLRPNCA